MRRVGVVVAALAAVVVIGILVARAASGQATPVASVGSTARHDVADGRAEPDAAAARAAAIRAVSLTGDVVRAGLISRRVMIESFSTPRFGPALADQTSSAVDAMLLELGE